jgi:hypothetical protein
MMQRLISLPLILVAGAAFAISFSYNVEFRNQLNSNIRINLSQYHAIEFDGARPETWSEDNLINSINKELSPGQVETIGFSDASGGFWVLWLATDRAGNTLCSGEVDFTKGKSPYIVVLEAKACKTEP